MSTVESAYYDYMGFDSAHTREVLAHYLPYFAGAAPVLELACGRGEFLDLLRAAGVGASGVDNDAGMVAAARARGLDVAEDDALDFVDAAKPEAYGGIFAAHFLEHLTPDLVGRLLAGVRRALRPGGVFVAAVPSPACYAVLTHDFWRDPTHVRFYDPSLVAFFCVQAGLEVLEVGGNPRNHPGPPPETVVPEPVTVHPDLADVIQHAIEQASHVGRRKVDPAHDVAYLMGHLVSVLAGRLRETQEELAALHRAHAALAATLWQPNEVYVVARG